MLRFIMMATLPLDFTNRERRESHFVFDAGTAHNLDASPQRMEAFALVFTLPLAGWTCWFSASCLRSPPSTRESKLKAERPQSVSFDAETSVGLR